MVDKVSPRSGLYGNRSRPTDLTCTESGLVPRSHRKRNRPRPRQRVTRVSSPNITSVVIQILQVLQKLTFLEGHPGSVGDGLLQLSPGHAPLSPGWAPPHRDPPGSAISYLSPTWASHLGRSQADGQAHMFAVNEGIYFHCGTVKS